MAEKKRVRIGQEWQDKNSRAYRVVKVVGFVSIHRVQFVVATTVETDVDHRMDNSVIKQSRFHKAFKYISG